MTNIAIWASGTGSNAQAIIDYFRENDHVNIAMIVSNRKQAGVIDKAVKEGIPYVYFSKNQIDTNDGVLDKLASSKIEVIVLAGFLLKIPSYLIRAFTDRILNIHPALLPKYGGKGMYGSHVHQAVYDQKETESGISIHLVNEHYDEGKILFQASTDLTPDDRPSDIGRKVLELEHYYYPRVIEAFVENALPQAD
ncbi:phosphoribosylglycinamide formyltransferase [Portibacter marinus]|uniref:phosphoribosylglycinamide formyltransferase n=1 Tax=Portibacter marinus TaxID=2898660 RepID=UPI001F3A4D59|nr:phosphoribosylglycinamide formyltransferase [Portibacter marinus]